jgi:nucleotide-binding universal stress UspA family protein
MAALHYIAEGRPRLDLSQSPRSGGVALCRHIKHQGSVMSYKTILVHCDASPKLSQRLDVAVDLAQRHGAHLVGVHVQAPFDVPAFADGMMPMDDLFTSYEAAAKADHDAAAAAFQKAAKGTHLPTE